MNCDEIKKALESTFESPSSKPGMLNYLLNAPAPEITATKLPLPPETWYARLFRVIRFKKRKQRVDVKIKYESRWKQV